MMTTDIEYTDRYGGCMPSLLRVCLGQCEGMGSYPVYKDDCGTPAEDAAWRGRHAMHCSLPGSPPCNGYHFIQCPDCEGSGRVAWWSSIARVPGWLVRGLRVGWNVVVAQPEMHAPGTRLWTKVKLWLQCAYWQDLRRLGN